MGFPAFSGHVGVFVAPIAAYVTVFRCVRQIKGVILEDMPDIASEP
jgi:hypothetical protein